MESKRIWLITTSYPRKPDEAINAGILARQTARQLVETGHEVTVLTPDKPGGVAFDDNLEGETLRWWRPRLEMADLRATSLPDFVSIASLMASARRQLGRRLQEEPPDAVIALWGLPSGIFARMVAKQARIPFAVWLLGSDVWLADRFPAGVRLLRRVASDADFVAADSYGLAERAAEMTMTAVSFLPSSISLDAKPRSPAPTATFGFVGRFHPNKGPDLAVRAMARLRDRHADVRLELHGAGAMEDELRTLVTDLELEPTVTIGGPLTREELAMKLAHWTALLIPSRIESIPMILGDAVQARIPVVATDVGDLGRASGEYDAGITVEPSADGLAAGVEVAISGLKAAPNPTAPQHLDPHLAARTFLKELHLQPVTSD